MPRVEARFKVTGRTKYTSDMELPNMLHGIILRSSKAHAIIKNIDYSEALKDPNVKAILTHQDVPTTKYNPIYNSPYPKAELIPRDSSILSKEVCYIGQPVLAVAAKTKEAAEEAIDKISIQYQELPHVTCLADAMKSGAPPVRSDLEKNEIPAFGTEAGEPIVFRTGNIEIGFAEAEEIFEDEFRTQRQSQVPMEPHSCICYWDVCEKLNVWATTQGIHPLREKLSVALNTPARRIKVYGIQQGGAFGSKLQMNDIDPICALLAKKAGLPVKIVLGRDEVFGTTSRHETIVDLKTGVKDDGEITARQCRYTLNTGAYTTHGPSVCIVGGMYFDCAYNTPHRLFEGFVYHTNTFPAGGMRGYGGPQIAFAVESQLDEIARRMDFDPIKFRLKNSFKKGDINPRTGFKIESCGLEEAARRGSEAVGWYKTLEKPKESFLRRGRGMAFQTIRGSGTYAKVPVEPIVEHSSVIAKLNEDGTLSLVVGAAEYGTGSTTGWRNIAAETLGINPKAVEVVLGDTGQTLYEQSLHASRGAFVIGSIIEEACKKVKDEILKNASEMLSEKKENLIIKGKYVSSKSKPDLKTSLQDLSMYSRYHLNKSIWATVSSEPPGNPPPFGAHFAEVEVNLRTGQVNLREYVAAQDVGKVIFKDGAIGQVHGAIAQGLGQCLMEEVKVDENGQLINPNFIDYKIPTIKDMPEVRTILVETDEPSGVGAKSISEASLHPVAPAIANAIRDAIGIRFKSLPITPDKILKALEKKRI